MFTRTKHGANRLARRLLREGFQCAAIHGNKSQNARRRALQEFKDGDIQVLLATDIAARGLDIDQLPEVVNYDLPEVAEDYVHRIGRTGRAGAEGRSHSFMSEDEQPLLRAIEKLLGVRIEREVLTEFFEPAKTTDGAHVAREGARNGSQPNRRGDSKPRSGSGAGRDSNRRAKSKGNASGKAMDKSSRQSKGNSKTDGSAHSKSKTKARSNNEMRASSTSSTAKSEGGQAAPSRGDQAGSNAASRDGKPLRHRRGRRRSKAASVNASPKKPPTSGLQGRNGRAPVG